MAKQECWTEEQHREFARELRAMRRRMMEHAADFRGRVKSGKSGPAAKSMQDLGKAFDQVRFRLLGHARQTLGVDLFNAYYGGGEELPPGRVRIEDEPPAPPGPGR